MAASQLRLGALVDALGGRLYGDPGLLLDKLAPLDQAQAGSLSFLSHPRYQPQLAATQAACVIVSPAFADAARARGACIVTPDPYLYFARATQWWRAHTRPARAVGVHPTAVVEPGAQIDPSATIGALCVVERGASVGAHTVLMPRVTLGADCHVGAHCLLHSGVVVGADGFGFAPHDGRWEKIEQLGAVRIGDHVEIGANSCVDRGALADTVIEDGVKIDNLVQIGHNVRIGADTAIAGNAGIAGSATIGAHCTLGGGAIVLGHLRLADGVHVSAASVVTRSILKPGQYTGLFPIDDNARWEKNAASLKQLHRLRQQVKALTPGAHDQEP